MRVRVVCCERYTNSKPDKFRVPVGSNYQSLLGLLKVEIISMELRVRIVHMAQYSRDIR